METIINVGEVWICIKTIRMDGSGDIVYIENGLYTCEQKNCLTDELKRKDHFWTTEGLHKNFKKIK